MRKRKNLRRLRAERTLRSIATRVDRLWCMGLVNDSLTDHRPLMRTPKADDFCHFAVNIAFGDCIYGQYMKLFLGQAVLLQRSPEAARLDNDSEFPIGAFVAWAQVHGSRRIMVDRGRAIQKGCIEHSIGRFRCEGSIEHWSDTLHQRRNVIAV